jgi:shikimate kinase/3-dehydroquinate synthase
VNALDRHLALVGFMGAGKTTVGEEVARRLGRPFRDLDHEIAAAAGRSVAEIFAEDGEPAFRRLEAERLERLLALAEPQVIALGGGAVTVPAVREALRRRALTVLLEVDVETAWARARGSGRPLAVDEQEFRRLYAARQPLYQEAADAVATDAEGVVLAAAGIVVGEGALDRLSALVPGRGGLALAVDETVCSLYGKRAGRALRGRLVSRHVLPPGEQAKTLAVCERLWQELTLDREGALVALGGGCTSDLVGFVAACYLRGVAWAAVPTTLVGQVDAAIGGKTGIDLPQGKNLVGAFHWPLRTVIDPTLLATLPARERRNGLAEVVKTGLLMGEPVWELPEAALVRRCAAFKAAVCLRDPQEQGERAMLNLGHTFAHALEAASGYRLAHGEAVALGLLAALRLSGLEREVEVVEEVLAPRPVAVDRERAWAALARDKKGRRGRPRLVLLEAPGRPRIGVELPARDVRRALESLIAAG